MLVVTVSVAVIVIAFSSRSSADAMERRLMRLSGKQDADCTSSGPEEFSCQMTQYDSAAGGPERTTCTGRVIVRSAEGSIGYEILHEDSSLLGCLGSGD